MSNYNKYGNSYKQSALDRIKNETVEITAICAGRWHEILAGLYPTIQIAADSHRAGSRSRKGSYCPLHGGKSGEAFRFMKGGAEYGSCACGSCGVFNNGFSLVMAMEKCNFRQAVIIVGYDVGYYSDTNGTVYNNIKEEAIKRKEEYLKQVAERKIEQDKKDREANIKGRERLRQIWSESVLLDHPSAEPARKYFINRGIGDIGTLNGEVRYHNALPFYVELDGNYLLAGKYPCLLGQIRTPNGKPVRLHRIYLDYAGNKLDLRNVGHRLGNNIDLSNYNGLDPKKMTPQIPLTSITGAAIQLDEAGSPILGVSEGLETSLAVSVATGLPMNCCINAEMLAHWLPADGTKYVFIFKDKDVSKTGEIKAKALQETLESYGIKVFSFEPNADIPAHEKGIDWADIFKQQGISGFPLEARNWRNLL